MDALFTNGPLDGQTRDVAIPFSVIDVCEPVDGGEPVLFTMITPNNGIWRYELDEVVYVVPISGEGEPLGEGYDQARYTGTKYNEDSTFRLVGGQWNRCGSLDIFVSDSDSVRIGEGTIEFGNGVKIRPHAA